MKSLLWYVVLITFVAVGEERISIESPGFATEAECITHERLWATTHGFTVERSTGVVSADAPTDHLCVEIVQ